MTNPQTPEVEAVARATENLTKAICPHITDPKDAVRRRLNEFASAIIAAMDATRQREAEVVEALRQSLDRMQRLQRYRAGEFSSVPVVDEAVVLVSKVLDRLTKTEAE